jgi:hypothetical protein
VHPVSYPIKKPLKLKVDEREIIITLGFGLAGCQGSFAQYGKVSNFPSE